MPNYLALITGFSGVILSLAAACLQWTLPTRIARLEDKLKDGRLRAEQVDQRIRWARLAPVVCTLMGACLLGATVLRNILD